MIVVWKNFFKDRISTLNDGRLAVSLADLYELPREDNIKRVRAAFNAEGKYYPTEWAVAKARGIKEDEYRIALGYPEKAMTVNPTKSDSYMDEQRSFKDTQPLI